MTADRWRAWAPAVLAAGLFLYAVAPWLPGAGASKPPRTVVLYGFSILGEAINQGVFPGFAREWQARTGEKVELVSSFAGSGTVTNQILMGVPAQVALLSLELDAIKLADAGIVQKDGWHRLPHAGIVNRTPFVILVRPGNPKAIRDFSDLAAEGVRVVHPDPLTSGGANWAILAEYGAGFREGGAAGGLRILRGVWTHVVAQAASARAARTQFENGFGDALITYEQDVLKDKLRGRLKGEIVYPRSTVLSEHTLVKIDRNVSTRDRPLVDAFVAYLWSEAAQDAFSRYGFRSVLPGRDADASKGFGAIQDPFLVSDFGGWKRVKAEIVDAVWKKQVLKELGK
jgi:sulfate/thiosulfate transport system substrate-binding protein